MSQNRPYLLDYCNIENPWDINMLHGVNEREKFERYVRYPNIHIFEVDIEDTNEASDEHMTLRHGGIGDVPMLWALQELVHHKKALKLDMKLPQGVPYVSDFYSHVFDLLREHWDPEIPIWINADIVKGPNCEYASHQRLDAEDFIRLCNKYCRDNPRAMLSLGYLHGYRDDMEIQPYDFHMLKEMQQIMSGAQSLTTISIRYINLMADMSFLKELLELSYVTIWNREDKISNDQYHQLAKYARSLNVFKDLTDLSGEPLWDKALRRR